MTATVDIWTLVWLMGAYVLWLPVGLFVCHRIFRWLDRAPSEPPQTLIDFTPMFVEPPAANVVDLAEVRAARQTTGGWAA